MHDLRCRRRDHAFGQFSKRRGRASVQRQILHRLGRNHLAHRSIGLIHQRRRCIHFYSRPRIAHLELQIDNGVFLRLQTDVVADLRLKTLVNNRDLVVARQQKRHHILTRLIALRAVDGAGMDLFNCDAGAGQRRAAGVRDGSADRSAKLLGAHHRGK